MLWSVRCERLPVYITGHQRPARHAAVAPRVPGGHEVPSRVFLAAVEVPLAFRLVLRDAAQRVLVRVARRGAGEREHGPLKKKRNIIRYKDAENGAGKQGKLHCQLCSCSDGCAENLQEWDNEYAASNTGPARAGR